MKEFLKKLMLNLNEDESENESNINKNYDLVHLFKQTPKNSNFNYDYDYKLDDVLDNELSSQNKENLEQRFMDENQEVNPFLVDRKKYGNSLKKLFVNSESSDTSFSSFSTETKIELLGGLTLWQFTAIIFAFLIFICN